MKTGDKIVLSITLAYGTLNLVLMGLAARGVFGPIPWSVFKAFIGGSMLGAVVSLVLLATADRSHTSWGIALLATAGFALATLLDLLCLSAAAAAV